jgi:DNA-binding MurR/RpiR family transcriptional regulator
MSQRRLASLVTVLDRIRSTHREMTPTYRRIAAYVIEHHQELAFAPASHVASIVGGSAATVVRFARFLGLSGYAELQSIVQREIRSGFDTVADMDRAIATDDQSSVLLKSLRADLKNIETLIASNQDAAFDRIIKILAEAPKIYLIGLRSNNGLIRHFESYLGWIGRKAHVLEPGIDDLPEQFMHLKAGDACLGVSCRRYARSSIEIFSRAKELGAITVALTDSELSPLVEHAAERLMIPVRFPAFFESKTAILSMMNALLLALAFADRDRTIKSLVLHETNWVRSGTYLNETFVQFKADIEQFAKDPGTATKIDDPHTGSLSATTPVGSEEAEKWTSR